MTTFITISQAAKILSRSEGQVRVLLGSTQIYGEKRLINGYWRWFVGKESTLERLKLHTGVCRKCGETYTKPRINMSHCPNCMRERS